jgi:mannobiose 2-epimerase
MTEMNNISKILIDEFTQELKSNILPFWLKLAPNPDNNGFYGAVQSSGEPYPGVPRWSLTIARLLWTFSAAYRHHKDPEYLEIATRAFNDLENTFWDEENKGFYWSVTYDGQPMEANKQIYLQGFVIYGYSEYYRATGDVTVLERAKEVYTLIEKYGADEKNGGYIEWLTQDWSGQPEEANNYLGTSAAKSQNTHLHLLEAYTNLLRVWLDESLREKSINLTNILLDKIYDEKTQHLVLLSGKKWNTEGIKTSPGHEIEFAWLVTDAAQVIQDAQLTSKVHSIAIEIANTTLNTGIDSDGSIPPESHHEKVLATYNREGWAQAEGIVGFLNAYQISHDEKYLHAANRIWEFTKKKVVNKEGIKGWYFFIDKEGKPLDTPAIHQFACPYHNGRAMMEGVERLK